MTAGARLSDAAAQSASSAKSVDCQRWLATRGHARFDQSAIKSYGPIPLTPPFGRLTSSLTFSLTSSLTL